MVISISETSNLNGTKLIIACLDLNEDLFHYFMIKYYFFFHIIFPR